MEFKNPTKKEVGDEGIPDEGEVEAIRSSRNYMAHIGIDNLVMNSKLTEAQMDNAIDEALEGAQSEDEVHKRLGEILKKMEQANLKA